MTPLQKFLKSQRKKGIEFNLDSFGAIIDDFITENECQMLITFPKGSGEPKVQDNMGAGPVLAFYFLLKALTPTLNDLFNILGGKEGFDREGLVDELLKLVREELLEERKEKP